MKALDCPVRPYAWGSRTAIAELQGRPSPSEQPEAELWIGAHPDDPSCIDGIGLDKHIEAAPVAMLGEAAVQRFGPRLPYLLKYLAAAAPLSIQVHPDSDQARDRYALGRLPDPHHKPEMLVARSRFEALCGFRDPRDTAGDLGRLDVPALAGIVAALAAGNVRTAIAAALAVPRPICRAALGGAVQRRAALPAERADLLVRLASAYPDDPGVLVALMLRRIVLEPGEAIFVPPGELHSYLAGTGVEAMAGSDNVIRGGLTHKHVDVAALLATVRTGVAPDPRIAPMPISDTVVHWPVPVEDFALYRVRHHGPDAETVLAPTGPRIVFCVSGSLDVRDGADSVRLTPGTAAFGAPGDGEIRLYGAGEAFVVSL